MGKEMPNYLRGITCRTQKNTFERTQEVLYFLNITIRRNLNIVRKDQKIVDS